MAGFETYAATVVGGVGTVLVGMGIFLIIKALQARAELTRTLLEEHATTPSGQGRPTPADGSGEEADVRPPASIFHTDVPVQPIHNAATARLRIEEITTRTVRGVGPYQLLPEGADRQWFLNGLTIRAALGLAVMGYGVANLALALGTALVLIGGTALAVGLPLILRQA